MPPKGNFENAEKNAADRQIHNSKRKRNGRVVRVVSINKKKIVRNVAPPTTSYIAGTTSVPSLPTNQYTTTLRRRAVRKPSKNTTSNSDGSGDISLGMKLIVAGGRVIVQSLSTLHDGLASPAQLVGVVQRGDVLLAIGDLSLANLPINQLMEGLRPLGTPDFGGFYERCLELRFEAGAGLGLLILHEEEHARSQDNVTTDAMFSLFPMVDQFSGTQILEPHHNVDLYRGEQIIIGQNDDNDATDDFEEAKDIVPGGKTLDEVIDKFSLNFDSLISAALAKERNFERERYKSDYFDWRQNVSELLRIVPSTGECQKLDLGKSLTKVERLDLGHKIMRTAKVLELNMEEIDKGRHMRSQKNFNSGISIRSVSSTFAKRQYNMDGTITSIRSSNDNPTGVAIDEESIDSDGSLDGVDYDKLLLRLAARDAIWRKLVISTLKQSTENIKNCGEEKSKDSTSQKGSIVFTQNAGHLFSQGNISRIPNQEMKAFAFPPQEITRILFDLATYIATSANDDITLFGASSKVSSNISSRRSDITKAGGRARASVVGDILLAKRFILHEALPYWLKSFRPLQLSQRIIVWPRRNSRADLMSVTGIGTVNQSDYTVRSSDAVSLKLISEGSHIPISNKQRKKTDLREAENYGVVDYESGVESETCFLVSYFCTEKIIGSDRSEELNSINRTLFIETYGAYLQIQACLSYAAFLKDKVVIDEILKIAYDDPNHRDAVNDIKKSNELLFYDLRKLSAVLQCLGDIRFETDGVRRKVLLDLCVSGYPDIQPWQVRTACTPSDQSESNATRDHFFDPVMEDLYYSYLCHLLNPVDGQEAAREDPSLLKEFCKWSVGIGYRRESDPTRMHNFMNIASPSSNYRNKYRRDIVMLLELSSAIDNHNLSLDLVEEIIGSEMFSSSKAALRRALYCLRRIGGVSLVICSNSQQETMGFEILRRVLKLFEKMSSSTALLCQNSTNISDELFSLFQQWKIHKDFSGDDANMYNLIDFAIDVSSVPAEVIKALLNWSLIHRINSLFPRLEHLLRRGIHFAVLNGEFSGTLLRLNSARVSFTKLNSIYDSKERRADDNEYIWEAVGKGTVSMDK